jgi:hypothetical protein
VWGEGKENYNVWKYSLNIALKDCSLELQKDKNSWSNAYMLDWEVGLGM